MHLSMLGPIYLSCHQLRHLILPEVFVRLWRVREGVYVYAVGIINIHPLVLFFHIFLRGIVGLKCHCRCH